jgi:hypothetical protein
MKRRPSLMFVVLLAGMLLVLCGLFWAWDKAGRAPAEVRAREGFLAALRYTPPPPPYRPSYSERARNRKAVAEIYDRLQREFPELALARRELAAEENGLLRMHVLAGGSAGGYLPMSQELRDFLEGRTEWDAERVRGLLEEHAELVAEIIAISELPGASVGGMPEGFLGFISARTWKQSTDLLMALGRLAAEDGDEERARAHTRQAQALAGLLRGMDVPNLLGETVVVLVDLSIQKQMLAHLLPAVGPQADLAAWRELVHSRDYSSEVFAGLMRGEWHTVCEHFLLPALVDPRHPQHPPDSEALARAHAAAFVRTVNGLPGTELGALASGGFPLLEVEVRGLSSESREIVETLQIGSTAWAKGYARAAAMGAFYDAGMELLAREKAGETLGPRAGESLTRDPIDGRAYQYDPAHRTLTRLAGGVFDKDEVLALPW